MVPSLQANLSPKQWFIPPFLPEHGCLPLDAKAGSEAKIRIAIDVRPINFFIITTP